MTTSRTSCGTRMRMKNFFTFLFIASAFFVTAIYFMSMDEPQPTNQAKINTIAPSARSAKIVENLKQQSEFSLSRYKACLEFNPSESRHCPYMTNIVVVNTAPGNYRYRNVIRATWGNDVRKAGIWLRFLVGKPKRQEHSRRLDQEEMIYGDLIRERCVDTYRNRTLKTVSLVSWLAQFCSKGGFVFRMDDNGFLNVDNVVSYASSILGPDIILGSLASGWEPERDPSSKYFIPFSEFEGSYFPDFIEGPAYMFNANMASALYNESLRTPFVRLDDVFLTGMVAGKLGIHHLSYRGFVNDIQWDTKKVELVNTIRWAVSIHKLSYNDILWLYIAAKDDNIP